MPSPFRSASTTAPGASRPLERSATVCRLAAGVIDDDPVEPLVGEDEVGRGAAVGQDRQRHVLVGAVIGLERAVAVAQEHQEIAVGVADEQVGLAVVVDVGDGQAGGIGSGGDGERIGQEASLAIAAIDGHAAGAQDDRVRDAVAFEVGDEDRDGRAGRGEGDRVGEPAAAQAAQHAERVRAGVDRHQVGRSARR